MNTITRTDIKRMLDNRDRLERRVRELENELKNVKRELTETEAPLYALLGRDDQVKRLKLDSRRGRRVLLKNADESRFKISEAPPVADFVSMCSSSIPGLVSIMADAFLECGGGVVIARHIRDLWITDPVFQFTHDVAGIIQAGCIVSDMRTVLNLGLVTMSAVAEVLGGRLDISGLSLKELKRLAKQMEITQSTRGKPKTIDELRSDCRPAMVMATDLYVKWKMFVKRPKYFNDDLKIARFLLRLSSIRMVPGRDVRSEQLLNEGLDGNRRLSGNVLNLLGLERLPDSHPAWYRPSLVCVMLEQIDSWRVSGDSPEPASTHHFGPHELIGSRPEIRLRDDTECLQSWLVCAESESLMLNTLNMLPH